MKLIIQLFLAASLAAVMLLSGCEDTSAGVNDGTAEETTEQDNSQENTSGPAPAIFFSEYVEGSSYNKAVEIYNGTTASIEQSDLIINIYQNGAITADESITLDSGTLAAGELWVVGHSSAGSDLLLYTDQTSGSLSFNGNDAVELKYNGVTVDVIGQIGLDPGSAWSNGETTTQDKTIRRELSVTAGDSNGSDAFDPSLEWNGFYQDSFDDLGSHVIP